MKFCMMFMKYNKTVIGFEYTMNLFGSGVSREPYQSLDLFFFSSPLFCSFATHF